MPTLVPGPGKPEFRRTLPRDAPGLAYRRRKGEAKSVAHWGQRKLLLAEIEFLTSYARPGATLVYAGAAPGMHIPLLLRLFPDVARFVLVDPNPFHRALKGCKDPRLELRQRPFDDALAREFAAVGDVLFVSDVRTADYVRMTPEQVEQHVWLDMCDQQRWFLLMRPRKALLKFRLPWAHGTRSRYLNGLVLLPIFGPQTTSEARLVPTTGTVTWDNTHYCDQMFRFNTVLRPAMYPHRPVALLTRAHTHTLTHANSSQRYRGRWA